MKLKAKLVDGELVLTCKHNDFQLTIADGCMYVVETKYGDRYTYSTIERAFESCQIARGQYD